ncbi:hypothetical protein CYMTET_6821 [Cymbomonas tetramitiformis]|uniref:DUF659 domain-containing protein n=1 Tax=Cymbomonas tetramitiformis TaxID=36881 RepID=A0AAE0G9L2_9CHLO|nr:hypothetical protein CYMTET_46123 [Cymbomonas tetramitiformis]KAK3266614.1 hypothetical protein CYMTET_24772 [Cymbomonas tetramitiformis]KAK3274106.1 hypothetical protein CYMTET_17695 [Cymbomonas tetramitiformis]KAK3279705.1 hypothetical protein CYMTET_12425 [Cymbomonas tetramitiformis]KAK3285582.1 hypothetical protein CYMTET_6821 [Cymbomonas tetramitiformis]
MESSDECALAYAEQEVLEEMDPSASTRRERQTALKEFGIQICTEVQARALNFLLGCFFFACKIPFSVVGNVFFVAFISALSPGYAKWLPGRTQLRTSILDEVYEETIVSTEAALDHAPGKRTLGIDGKTNTVGRATCNIGEAKLGISAYVTTKYFGKREHSGRVQANYVYEEIHDRVDKFQAIVADNTGNMQVMFRLLRAWFQALFIFGCCIHVLDLLVEDMVKLESLSLVVADFHFVTVFLKRFSMLWETLLSAQEEKFGIHARKLKVFPLTRFAYAYLMIETTVYNWSILRDIPEWPEYSIVKKKAIQRVPNSEADFERFETLVGDSSMKKKGDAVNRVLQPLSTMLHYLEGDSVPPSHLLPLYCIYFQTLNNLPLSVTMLLDADDIRSIKELAKERWLGAARKVGLRHDVHCLAFCLDVYVQALVVLIFGESELLRIQRTFTDKALLDAIKNYCGGNTGPKYQRLVQEFDVFRSQGDPYTMKLRAVTNLVRSQVPEKIHPLLTDAEKSDKFTYFLCCLKHFHLISSVLVFWNSLYVVSAECAALVQMAIHVLQILLHACNIERINKDADAVHSKARPRFGETNSKKAIYCYTNLVLQFKVKMSYLEYLSTVLSPEDQEDVLRTFDTVEDSSDEELPAGDDVGEGDSDDDGELDLAEPEIADSRLAFECPTGFSVIEKPAALISSVQGLKDLFIAMLWKEEGWELGKKVGSWAYLRKS